jgi:hypothetical protein
LYLGTNKTARLTIGANGNVTIAAGSNLGIGTTSPSYLFDAQGDAAVGIGAANSNNYTFRIRAGTSGLARIIAADTSDAGYIDYDHSGNSWIFRTNGSEACRIDSSQRLLVGTSTSITALVQAGLQVHGTGALGYINSGRWSNDSNRSELVFSKSRGAAVGTRGVVQNNDNTGAVTFTGDDGTSFVTCAQIVGVVDGTPGANDMPGRLVFSTTADGAASPTERMRIGNNGHISNKGSNSVNIGVDGWELFPRGSAWFTATDGFGVVSVARRGTDGSVIDFYKGGTNVGTISVTSSATSYNTSSDYRLKENVVPLTGAIDRVNQLQVHRFNFISDPDTTVDGFLAHEAQTVVPECATGTKDEVDAEGNPIYQGIDQSKLVPLLTAALQEAIGRIETLEAEVAALKGV